MTDYYPFLAKAAADLPVRSRASRRELYGNAKKIQKTQLSAIVPPMNKARLKGERAALKVAIKQLEEEWRSWERFSRKGSTGLLIVGLWFPSLWLIDLPLMALFWVARAPQRKS
jgi:hypothetical protein